MRWLAEKVLKSIGWEFVGVPPEAPQFIVVGAPHTSNWDFIVFLAAISHWSMRPKYLGKHTLFEGPFGWLFRRWGGIPVDRTKPGGLIQAVSREFARSESFALVIAPEGTRKFTTRWKSGFLKIAEATGAPIVPARINYETKKVTLGGPIAFDGSVEPVMDTLRAFFAMGRGRNPEGAGTVALRGESPSGTS